MDNIKFILVLQGVVFSSFGFGIYLDHIISIPKSELTYGKIVDLNEGRADPILKYNCLGESYLSSSNSYSIYNPKVGDVVEIYCLKTDPEKIIINSFFGKYFTSMMLGTYGIIMLIIGTLLIIKRKKFIYSIKLNGKVVDALVINIDNKKILTKYYCTLKAKYIDNSNKSVYNFDSDIILDSPSLINIGDEIKVFVDPNDYRKYYVDLSFLSQKNNLGN